MKWASFHLMVSHQSRFMVAVVALMMAMWPQFSSYAGVAGARAYFQDTTIATVVRKVPSEEERNRAIIAFRGRIAGLEAAFNAIGDAESSDAVAKYERIRALLLSELAEPREFTDVAVYEVFLLSWHLSATERVRLLTDAMAIQPIMRGYVTDALRRCISLEYDALPPEAGGLTRRLLGPQPAPIATNLVMTSTSAPASEWSWSPDARLAAMDAAELAEAWLSVPQSAQGMPTLLWRIDDLLTLATFATITPAMVWPGSDIPRLQNGERMLVAAHGLFPVLMHYADLDAGHPSVGYALAQWRERNRTAEIVGVLEALQKMVDEHSEAIAALQEADVRIEKKLRSLESDVKVIKERLSAMEERLGRIEDYLEGNLNTASRSVLLERFAPILRHHGVDSGPIMSPADFVRASLPMARKDADERLVAAVAALKGRPFKDAQQFSEWLGKSLGDEVVIADLSGGLELIPLGLRRAGVLPVAVDGQWPRRDGNLIRSMNTKATGADPSDPAPVYGIVRNLSAVDGPQHYSVSYYWFHAWNETAFPEGEGNHEGDWGGIDLTVSIPFSAEKGADASKAEIVDAIYHEHGNPNRFRLDALELVEGVRPVVYLERGTNEAHPKAGKAGRNKGVWPFEYPVVREHLGRGWHYDTRIGLVDLLDPDSRKRTDVHLVWTYRGQWGEYDADEWKWLHGHNTTNPPSPIYQSKFSSRSQYLDHR